VRKDVAEMLKGSLKGTVKYGECMARHTSFKIGGPADVWVQPHDAKELKKLVVTARRAKMPFFVIGGGTNLLVKDDGFRGIVAHLSSPYFKKVSVSGDRVRVGAGVNVSALVRLCCEKGLGGIDSLIGIPGTVGGAIRMNAGGWNSPIYKNIGDLVASLKVMDSDGSIKMMKKGDLKFAYRYSNLDHSIILEAVLQLYKDDKAALRSRCSQFLKIKRQKQALDVPSAGCVFKNPPDSQFTCGQMIDTLGLKGKRMGGAEISEKHANFIVNRTGKASCKDVMSLIEFIQGRVKESYHVPLELEIKVV
jgi:UDP-N-acetylmuramate dehydrogenase